MSQYSVTVPPLQTEIEIDVEPSGIYGGRKSLEAWLAFMDVASLDELDEEQLSLELDLGLEEAA